MSGQNKRVKNAMIERYGAECFIEKLKLRDTSKLKYKGKAQYRRMKMLTYHHIKMKSRRRKSDNRKWSFTVGRESSVVTSTI